MWDLWKELRHRLIGADKEIKRLFESMSEKEIRLEEESLFLKWDQRGICQNIKLDLENRIAQIGLVTDWHYPKITPIGKKTVQKINEYISSYFEKQGYSVRFVSIDSLI